MTTKPYAAGGAYIDRMSDYCGGCRYDPRTRLGVNACPFTAGYWAFLDRHRGRLAGNPRLARRCGGSTASTTSTRSRTGGRARRPAP